MSTYAVNMVVLVSSNQDDFYVYQVMINAPLVCLRRQELGSCGPDCTNLYRTLTGSFPLVVATNLKYLNQFNLPGINIFVLQ